MKHLLRGMFGVKFVPYAYFFRQFFGQFLGSTRQKVGLIGVYVLLGGAFWGPMAAAQTSIINNQGGFCAFNESGGGLRVHASTNSQFQVERCSAPGTADRSRQFFFAGSLPPASNLFNSMYLRVGNTIVGADNFAGVQGAQFFREISTSGGSALGDGVSTTVYAADVGGLTYTITQRVSYVFPNDFYTVDIEIDVPAANTQQVDFYSWTDLMLDGDDNGQCIVQTDFPRFAGGDNTARNYFAGYRERDTSLSWDSFSCGFFADATQNSNQIIGPARSLPNTNFTNNIDIGAATHWEVVDTGGTGASPFRAQFDFIFSVKEAALTKFFGPADEDNNDTISAGETTSLTFRLTNVPGNPAVGPIGFTDTLPASVTIVGTPEADQCLGAVTTGITSDGRETVTLTGGALNGGDAFCEITLDVTSNVTGDHINASDNISNLTFAQNQVNAALIVAAPVLGTITGSVFFDENLNTLLDAGEPEISGITVTAFLIGPDDEFGSDDDIEVASGETGSPYELSVPPGTYQLRADGTDADLPAGFRPSITTSRNVTIGAGEIFSGEDFGIAQETMAVPSVPGNIAVCDVPTNWRQLQYDTDGNASIAGLTANITSNLGTGGVSFSAFDPDPSFLDEEEHTTTNSGLGTNILRYTEPQIVGLNETLTQRFVGREVYEVNMHFVSIDQIGFEFLQADNPGLGWELLSASDDGQNIAVDPDFFFVDTIDGDADRSSVDRQAGGDASRSADGSFRIYTLTDEPISQIIWRFREDPSRNGMTDLFHLATEVCMPLDFSDAPLTGTNFGPASHGLNEAITLGGSVTADEGAFDSADASADVGDDGAEFPELVAGAFITVPVLARGSGGFLQAWFDWNGNGNFSDAGEQIGVDLQDSTGAGTIALPITPPIDAVPGQSFARLRWSTRGGLDPNEDAPDGEVEDYPISLVAGPIAIGGTVFVDNGAGAGGLAHDGVLQGAETGQGGVTLEAIDAASGNVIAVTQTAGDGTYTLGLPATQDGLETFVQLVVPNDRVLVSNTSTAPIGSVDPANGMFALTPRAGEPVSGLDFGLVGDPRLTLGQSQTVAAGSAIIFAHTFTSETEMEVSFALQNIVQSVAGVFTSTLFLDADCDGVFGAGDGPLVDPLPVGAGETLCVLVRITSDVGAANGTNISFDLEASADYANLTGSFASSLAPAVLINSDEVRVGNAGSLVLTKEVCNRAVTACDLASGAGFARSNAGGPGDVLVYRITFEVNGPDPVDGVLVVDKTPAFSSLTDTAPAVIIEPDGLSCALSDPGVPVAGFQGVLAWTCAGIIAPGSLGTVSFEVEIAG